ncbi:hypothetical protein FRACA_400007 [Frankia canadensis]|uniref:Uncharacterized protein n=1 Tax=Frankia canadensis TaxID=1836972 RepID=A0A2I2KWP1_9ACTN|nr:hypothetical protein FRACA_400007 [Frankia canadensis]SOU57364.1 hypothetical protein FRACA_400007 [Frankia canadensis]
MRQGVVRGGAGGPALRSISTLHARATKHAGTRWVGAGKLQYGQERTCPSSFLASP